jgi:uncharacterized membrane protein YdcZ (DUF606 family)
LIAATRVGMNVHPHGGWRVLGAAFMVGGIALIARFQAC